MGRWRKDAVGRALAVSVALALVLAACGGGVPARENPTQEPAGGSQATSVPEAGGATGASQATGSMPGQVAIPFSLPSAQGPEASLAGYQGRKNMVLVFYRAFW